MKKKNGFTLIELLAVIIILGILMIIAIPSVTKYISDSRKNAYVDTAKEIITGARNLVNEGILEMYDTNTTYYIPTSCIKTENARKSPYGEFVKSYVIVTYDGKGYDYYWVSVDDAGQGIKDITKVDELNIDNIESDLKNDDINEQLGVGNRENVKIFNDNCTSYNEMKAQIEVNLNYSSNGGVFSDGSTDKKIKYRILDTKYSYTENISSDGTQLSKYGANWGNDHIVGTDRGDQNKAHVITIPGAKKLKLTITFGTGGSNSNYACAWEGSHPNYTAKNYCNSTSFTGKLWGPNHNLLTNTKHYEIDGDTVTLSFYGHYIGGDAYGDCYGYYAIVQAIEQEESYEEPTKNGQYFWYWKDTKNNKYYSYDDINNMLPNTSNVVAQWGNIPKPLCRRSSSLHKEICSRNDNYGCNRNSIFAEGSTITYGNYGTDDNNPMVGDAFDCDVNNDGIYDSLAERFYYIGEHNDENGKTISTLIYFSSFYQGSFTDYTSISYDGSRENWHGPTNAFNNLPNTDLWSNDLLIKPGTRNIVANNGEGKTSGGVIDSFTYTGKAARLPTFQELSDACGDIKTFGSLSSCTFLMENTKFVTLATKNNYLWLETPDRYSRTTAYIIEASTLHVGETTVSNSSTYGIKPVIEVYKDNIDY